MLIKGDRGLPGPAIDIKGDKGEPGPPGFTGSIGLTGPMGKKIIYYEIIIIKNILYIYHVK